MGRMRRVALVIGHQLAIASALKRKSEGITNIVGHCDLRGGDLTRHRGFNAWSHQGRFLLCWQSFRMLSRKTSSKRCERSHEFFHLDTGLEIYY